jgi:hypothetical protein
MISRIAIRPIRFKQITVWALGEGGGGLSRLTALLRPLPVQLQLQLSL